MGSTEDWWYSERLPEIREEERIRKEKENSKNLVEIVEEMKKMRESAIHNRNIMNSNNNCVP